MNKFVPIVSRDALAVIDELDQISNEISQKLDGLLLERDKNPSKFTKKSIAEVQALRQLLEDLADRKAQVAVRNYDLIDQHVHIIDQEIKLVETAMRIHAVDVSIPFLIAVYLQTYLYI